MDTYKLIMYCHVTFTLLAFVCGLIAIIVNPKGSTVHRKSGDYYLYFYLGVVLTGYIMIAIQFKVFFLGLTLFGTFLVFSGKYYANETKETISKNWWLLIILILAIFVHIADVIYSISNIEYIGYGWLIVKVVYTIIPIAILIFELTVKSKRYLKHAVMMLLSFIPLIDGLLARLSPPEFVWVFWILGYIVFIPLIILWFKKSKKMQQFLR